MLSRYANFERHTVTDTLRDFPSVVGGGGDEALARLLDVIPR